MIRRWRRKQDRCFTHETYYADYGIDLALAAFDKRREEGI
jgi:hypothetical protein